MQASRLSKYVGRRVRGEFHGARITGITTDARSVDHVFGHVDVIVAVDAQGVDAPNATTWTAASTWTDTETSRSLERHGAERGA